MRVGPVLYRLRKVSLAELGANHAPKETLPPVSSKPPKGGDMLRYIMATMAEHPEAVVLTQVGSFYEMYFEHAVEYGPKLNLKIARKRQQSPRADLPFVNMAGFPSYQLEKYVKPLVQTYGKTVVLLEQDPRRIFSSNNEAEKRPITRILTPGTLVSESFVDPWKHNYLTAVQFTMAHIEALKGSRSNSKNREIPPDSPVGLSWVDLADGSFKFQETTFQNLGDDLVRISPNEILVDSSLPRYFREYPKSFEILELERFFVSSTKFPPSDSLTHHDFQFDRPAAALAFVADSMGKRAQGAASAIVSYVDEHLPGTNIKFQLPERYTAESALQIDSRTRDGLELFQSLTRDSVKGSLFNVMRSTVTPSGSRLLQEWLTYPLQDMDAINKRLDMVELFIADQQLQKNLVIDLRDQPDGRRIIQKLSMRKLDPLELVGFARSVQGMLRLAAIIETSGHPSLAGWALVIREALIEPEKLAKKILKAVNTDNLIAKSSASPPEQGQDEDEAPVPGSQGLTNDRIASSFAPILNPGYSKRLAALHATQEAFSQRSKAILERVKQQYEGQATASIRWLPLYSYHIHLKATKGGLDLPQEHILSRTKRTASIFDKELSRLGSERESFYTNLEALESEILEGLRKKALEFTEPVREALTIVDLIDVTQSMASLATQFRMVRPQFSDEPILEIRDGRHIVVESGLEQNGQLFKGNDCHLTTEQSMCMVTGPNMGGKSTYIRQVALITLLAHIGSFVPAESALLGIADRIFCRIGAGDDLYRGRSTFMMEMLETANILRRSTPKSLAILDEVGRGTSAKDGVAIAYATVKHLIDTNKCRALFASHFGEEIAEIITNNGLSDRMTCLKSTVSEEDGEVVFDYRLKPGVSDDSHGILVAQLADFPPKALHDASSLLSSLEFKT